MAIQCVVSDRHLYTVSSNFLASNVPYSITVWINGVWSSGATLSFVGLYDGTITTPVPTTGLQIGARGSPGQAVVWTYGGTILAQSAAGEMTPFDNIWCLITYTFDGSTHRIYRDDTLIATSTTAVVVGTFTQIYVNGYPPTGTTNECSTHKVDAYAYYGRQLSIDEITTIYNARGTRHGIVDGLIARYDFDELPESTTVTSVADVSGSGNTLLDTGAGTPITYTYADTTASSNLRMVQ